MLPELPHEEGMARSIVYWTNRIRQEHGLEPVIRNAELCRAAWWMAGDMYDGEYIDHTDRRGRLPHQRAWEYGYQGGCIGENLGRGYQNVLGAIDGWMNSEGHRRNLLEPRWKEIGTGYRGTCYVQVFGVQSCG